MKRNKFLALILIAALSTSLFTGCKKQESSQGTNGTVQETDTKESAEESETSSTDTQTTGQSFEGKTLSLMMAKSDTDSEAINASITAFEQKYGVTVEVEETPGADEGENILKVRAATNSLPDILMTSVGAKLAELDPSETLVDLSAEAFVEDIDDGYVDAVTVDGGVYGVPMSTSNVAGVYYNKKIYESLGLQVPETWEAFLQNCAKVKETGLDPVAAPYESTGLSQIPFLANYYYVQKEIPTFAEDYTANKISLSETDVFVRGLQKMYDLAENNYLNEDYLSTSNDAACGMLAQGNAAHMIIRSNILATIDSLYPENSNDIGFFPLPDEDASVRGVAKWMPPAYCITQGTKNVELAKAFLEFTVSDEAVKAYCSAQKPSGAFMIKGVSLPEDIYPALKEAQEWVDKASTPVMEYYSPIKGPNQASICIQVASGSITAEEAVKQIEEDNRISAEQLGLENWTD